MNTFTYDKDVRPALSAQKIRVAPHASARSAVLNPVVESMSERVTTAES